MTPWYSSLYTGLFTSFSSLTLRPHDPQLFLFSGTTAAWSGIAQELSGSSIGWDAEAAEGACVGEAVERLQAYALPDDQIVSARYAAWPLDEPAVPPERWVLFHPEQYLLPGFPFEPLTRETECDWVCCRQALSGASWWAPADMVWLNAGGKHVHRFCPGLSTGLACGRTGDPLVLRGLQEVIERDAVVGAWWGRYALEEFAISDVIDRLHDNARDRILRPNLTFRCYRIASPYSRHVTLVTVSGEDREGWCFSVGAACRETAAQSWSKSLLEAIHGRHYVRYVKQEMTNGTGGNESPATFRDHAVWYTIQPQLLELTMLGQKHPLGGDPFPDVRETVASLAEKLGPDRPVLFRSLTPPPLATEGLGWHVLRVIVPGLQPLHGDHRLPHLGGPLWSPRGLAEWRTMPPHPMP
jgi:thiazole/oxazole-forming peptide maturase SagD family component